MEEVIKEELGTQLTGRCQIHMRGFFLAVFVYYYCLQMYTVLLCVKYLNHLNHFDEYSTFLNALKAKDGLDHLH